MKKVSSSNVFRKNENMMNPKVILKNWKEATYHLPIDRLQIYKHPMQIM